MIEYKKAFVDTAPIVYFLQGNELYYEKMKGILRNFRKMGTLLISSDITVAEYLVMPYRENNLLLAEALESFIKLAEMQIIHTSEQIAINAARIRAEYKGFKAMDAFQLATALESDCDLFLTNDKQLRQFSGITCLTIDNYYLNNI